ncbi:MAG: GIY-YIG nuclease family protein [Salibacteraceae bacterium]
MQAMKSYYTYILKCSDGKYYIGVTNNLERRLIEHQQGFDPKSFTFSRRPVELVYSLQSNDINEAIAFEKQLKGWTRRKKEALIRGEFDLLPKLSKKKFD